jgi:tetratricopeptide (TPR) repeat protein
MATQSARHFLQWLQLAANRSRAPVVWQMMGIALEKVEELDNARDAFERASELEADYGPTWVNLGNVLLSQKRSEFALNAGRRAMELMPEHPSGYGITGRALMQQKNYQEALPLLEKCDEVRTKHPRWQKPSKQWIAECKRHLHESTKSTVDRKDGE